MKPVRASAVAAAAALALAGCGSSGERSHLTREGAMEMAMNAVGSELRADDSPLHGHRVRLLGLSEGKSSTGTDVWIARVRDTTEGSDFCVRVWLTSIAVGTSPHVEFVSCEAGPEPEPPPPPATTKPVATY